MAHEKYNSLDYSTALQILKELTVLDPHHLPTLLLLGCTCYSLGLYSLAVFYNKQILTIDPNFAEAYSNLGTAYRTMAQAENSISSINLTPAQHIALAEENYKKAIAIRPKYWDANVNLANLLSAQERLEEALAVYQHLDEVLESVIPIECRVSQVQFTYNDDECINRLYQAEYGRRRYLADLSVAGSPIPEEAYIFTQERRRDVFFSIANIYFRNGNMAKAKFEYLKSLIVIGIDLPAIYAGVRNGSIANTLISPASIADRISQPNNAVLNQANQIPSTVLQTLAKMYQDEHRVPIAIALYYASLDLYPMANACNNIGILISSSRLAEAIDWYHIGLKLDPSHVHLFTNLGSALKDKGHVTEGISYYEKAISIQPDFFIALANLANVFKDIGRVEEAIELYRRALKSQPDFIEAFCNYVNSLLSICDWSNRDANLLRIRQIVEKQLKDGFRLMPRPCPSVLPFHTFTYSSLTAWMIREISRRNADRVRWNVVSSHWFPGFPLRPIELINRFQQQRVPEPIDQRLIERSLSYPYPYTIPTYTPGQQIKVGYVSSDFNNHPLAHLMQSVFGMHDRSKFKVICYSLSPTDHSIYRQKIEQESDIFLDVSSWTVPQIIEQIVQDGIHILCNLNGYTKGGRNEIFAARPAPIQMLFMGFAGTMGAGSVFDPTNLDHSPTDLSYEVDSQPLAELRRNEFFEDLENRWIDYMVVDDIACPKHLVCGEPVQVEEDSESCKSVSAGLRDPVVPSDDRNRVYTEGLIYMPLSFFVNDHRQGFREPDDPEIEMLFPETEDAGVPSNEMTESPSDIRWRKEEIKRLKMRNQMFPGLREDTVIYANFNQLYKVSFILSW